MGGSRVHRSQAKRYTAMAQAAGAVLLTGAVAAYAFLPLPGQVAPPPPKADIPTGGEPSQETAAVDFDALAVGLVHWDAKVAQPDPEQASGDGEPREAPEPQTGSEWKYLGAIREPTRLVAIVEADGAQRMVTAGLELDGVKVLEVNADAIVVASGPGRKTIPLAKKQGAIFGSSVDSSSAGAEMIEEGGESDAEMLDPRTPDRRGINRPSIPGSKGVPRPPRPGAGAKQGPNPGRPSSRPTTPQGN